MDYEGLVSGTTTTFPIGDFSRATQISVKMLRHYHQLGLLEPASVDSTTGYRRYTPEQIPVAQVIRRFRDLDMPLHLIRAVLATTDPDARNRLISGHLVQLERELTQTQQAVASLRELLDPPAGGSGRTIGRRRVEATPSAAVTAVIDIQDAESWYQGALGELHATIAAQGLVPTGCPGGIYVDELFTDERGSATVFVPCRQAPRAIGRVTDLTVPAVELATITHTGTHHGIDRAYGELAAYVAHHALAVRGPIREYYRVSRQDTLDESKWLTEIGWPIFQTSTNLLFRTNTNPLFQASTNP